MTISYSQSIYQDNHSFIPHSYIYVLKEEYTYLENLCLPLNIGGNTKLLFYHILQCTLRSWYRFDDPPSIPVPSRTIHRDLRGADANQLVASGLISMKEHSISEHLCREFTVTPSILNEFLSIGENMSEEDYCSSAFIHLKDGRLRRKDHNSVARVHDENGNSYPELTSNAIEVLFRNGCHFNYVSLRQNLKLREERLQVNGLTGYIDRQLRVDSFCFKKGVLALNPEPVEDGIYCYRPRYHAKSTGRIFTSFGGLQSCTREFKAIAYSTVPGVKNYDIWASQPNALIQFLDEAGLDSSVWHHYLENREEFPKRLGVSNDTWKQLLYAMIFGAVMPASIHVEDREILNILKNEIKKSNGFYDANRLQQLLVAFKRIARKLYSSIKRFHRYLEHTYIYKYAKRGYRQQYYIENACGNSFYPAKYKSSELPKKLAAFLLQGLESCFIHHITILGDKYGYKVMANEHDGVVCIGEIPDAAKEEAKQLSGFLGAELIEKPFAISPVSDNTYTFDIAAIAA